MKNPAASDLATLDQRRADLEARIAHARGALTNADRSEREAAEYVTTLRALAAGNGPRSARRKADRDARHVEATTARSVAAVRVSANAVLQDLQAELEVLTKEGDAT